MKLKVYRVTVNDNYTVSREFATMDKAMYFYRLHPTADMFRLEGEKWIWMFGASVYIRTRNQGGTRD